MDFELNEEMITSRGHYPDDEDEADYGWWETVGLQFKKDTITEMSFSENLQYNKTIAVRGAGSGGRRDHQGAIQFHHAGECFEMGIGPSAAGPI